MHVSIRCLDARVGANLPRLEPKFTRCLASMWLQLVCWQHSVSLGELLPVGSPVGSKGWLQPEDKGGGTKNVNYFIRE